MYMCTFQNCAEPFNVDITLQIVHIGLSTYMTSNHVWPLCSRCLDCLEDVHSSFNFDSLNFRHTSNEHTTARHAITGGGEHNEKVKCHSPL